MKKNLTDAQVAELTAPKEPPRLELCERTELDGVKGLCFTGRYFRSVADLMEDMKKYPEKFDPNKRYTLHQKRPTLRVQAKQIYSVTVEG